MLKPVKFANAVGLVAAFFQLGWTIKVEVVPEWANYWMNSIMPGYNMTLIGTNTVSWGMAIIGVLIMGILAWVGAFLVIWLYNCCEKCCGGKCDDGKCGDKCCNDSCCGK